MERLYEGHTAEVKTFPAQRADLPFACGALRAINMQQLHNTCLSFPP
jgi:hypothetical protein